MEYGGRPYDPTVPSEQSKQLSAGMKTTVDDYIAWAEENGHVTPAASSVVASYIVEDPKREGSKVVIANAFGMMVSEITREVERQQAERASMMGESKMRISKRQLTRIIKEEKAKMLNEVEERVVLSAWDQAITNVEAVERELQRVNDPLGKQLAIALMELNQAYEALELHFDDEAGRNPGGSIG